MRVAGLVVVLLASSAGAEEWADEKKVLAPVEARLLPRWGVTGGLHLGVSPAATLGPIFGARLGVRLRLVEHVAVSLSAQWDFGLVDLTPPPSIRPVEEKVAEVHVLNVLASVDVFTVSAFKGLFQPELALSLVGGARMLPGVPPFMAPPLGGFPRLPIGAVVGPQLQLVRLRPSGWWFPVWLQVLFSVNEQGLFFQQLVVGVGL